MSAYKIIDHEYDVLVVGAGGAGLRAAVGLSEIFEDYIQDEKIKNAANLLTFLLSIIVPLVTIILLLYKF